MAGLVWQEKVFLLSRADPESAALKNVCLYLHIPDVLSDMPGGTPPMTPHRNEQKHGHGLQAYPSDGKSVQLLWALSDGFRQATSLERWPVLT